MPSSLCQNWLRKILPNKWCSITYTLRTRWCGFPSFFRACSVLRALAVASDYDKEGGRKSHSLSRKCNSLFWFEAITPPGKSAVCFRSPHQSRGSFERKRQEGLAINSESLFSVELKSPLISVCGSFFLLTRQCRHGRETKSASVDNQHLLLTTT